MKSLLKKTNLRRTIIQRRYLYISLTLSITFVSCNNDASQPKTTLKDEIENQDFVIAIEENISDLPDFNEVAITIINNKSTESIGFHKDNGVLRRKNNAYSIYEIGSITKVFTSK